MKDEDNNNSEDTNKMSRKNILTLVMAVAIFLSMGIAAHATVFTFTDQNNYWGHNKPWSYDQCWTENSASGVLTANDKKDVVGYPDITGGSVRTDASGSLDEVLFDYSTWTGSLTNRRGDLFIDIGDDGYWDFFVIGANRYANGDIRVGAVIGDIYRLTSEISVMKGINNDAYIQSQNTWNIGGGFRRHHPVWYNLGSTFEIEQIGNAGVSGFNGSGATQVRFTGLNAIENIESNPFTIAWTPMCGNDVVMSTIKPIPNPEPTTMLLLGFGLIGLAGSRRKLKKS